MRNVTINPTSIARRLNNSKEHQNTTFSIDRIPGSYDCKHKAGNEVENGMNKDVFDKYGNYKYPDYSNSQYTNYATATCGILSTRQIGAKKKMAKKKFKVKIDGLEISGSYLDVKNMSTVFTLAALQQRSEGHLSLHEKYLNTAISIDYQLTEQMGE